MLLFWETFGLKHVELHHISEDYEKGSWNYFWHRLSQFGSVQIMSNPWMLLVVVTIEIGWLYHSEWIEIIMQHT